MNCTEVANAMITNLRNVGLSKRNAKKAAAVNCDMIVNFMLHEKVHMVVGERKNLLKIKGDRFWIRVKGLIENDT